MDKRESEALLKILVALAQADGKVDSDERRLLSALSKTLGVAVDASGGVNVDAEFAKLNSREARDLAFRTAVAIANIDGKCSAPEHDLLLKLRDVCAPGAPVDLGVVSEREVLRTRRARAAVASATDAFLDEIARRGDAMPRAEYEKLLAELDAKKSAAISKLTTA